MFDVIIIVYLAGKIKQYNYRRGFLMNSFRKIWILCTVDRMFYPLILYPIYIVFGPWSIGYLIEDYIGVVFAWGIIIQGSFLPGSFTYAYGFLQVIILSDFINENVDF